MDDDPALPTPLIKLEWLHEASTERRPVPGAFVINVLAPQTHRAVIAITALFQRRNDGGAVLTSEGFLAGDEDHGVIVGCFLKLKKPR